MKNIPLLSIIIFIFGCLPSLVSVFLIISYISDTGYCLALGAVLGITGLFMSLFDNTWGSFFSWGTSILVAIGMISTFYVLLFFNPMAVSDMYSLDNFIYYYSPLVAGLLAIFKSIGKEFIQE